MVNGKSLFVLINLALISLSCSVFADSLIRPGYGENDDQDLFTGNIAIEGISEKEIQQKKTYKVYCIEPETGKINKLLYKSHGTKAKVPDGYFYQIEQPDIVVSPVNKDDETILDQCSEYIVLDVDFQVDHISVLGRTPGPTDTEIKKIETLFGAAYKTGFPDFVYADNLIFDTPFVSVRFSTTEWLLVDSYILREDVDYGYGYYVPEDIANKKGAHKFGQYLYNRKNGTLLLIKPYYLIGEANPIMITSGKNLYLFGYVMIGKSYGHYEIVLLKGKKAETIFVGSDTGS
ncbi:MAG: hypothetical protein OEY67_02445 [Gammaproteobacteria bacterium]|nr:hypothetical protein [Gammaproteobacteria bacterium]